ncbi:unnamed protein product [Knipowitschia caucasica]
MMLGSRGRTYVLLLLLSLLYSGPVQNIRHNVEASALSLSCNLDLQLNLSHLLWRQAVDPVSRLTHELTISTTDLGAETLNISSTFQTFRQEVMRQYGAEPLAADANQANDTLTTRTMMQCEDVVQGAVLRCSDWFNGKWAECLSTVSVPVLNQLLCFPMKFSFLCDILRVMTPWCTQRLPVDTDSGRQWEQLNRTMDLFRKEFIASVQLQVRGQGSDQCTTTGQGSEPASNYRSGVRASVQLQVRGQGSEPVSNYRSGVRASVQLQVRGQGSEPVSNYRSGVRTSVQLQVRGQGSEPVFNYRSEVRGQSQCSTTGQRSGVRASVQLQVRGQSQRPAKGQRSGVRASVQLQVRDQGSEPASSYRSGIRGQSQRPATSQGSGVRASVQLQVRGQRSEPASSYRSEVTASVQLQVRGQSQCPTTGQSQRPATGQGSEPASSYRSGVRGTSQRPATGQRSQ